MLYNSFTFCTDFFFQIFCNLFHEVINFTKTRKMYGTPYIFWVGMFLSPGLFLNECSSVRRVRRVRIFVWVTTAKKEAYDERFTTCATLIFLCFFSKRQLCKRNLCKQTR